MKKIQVRYNVFETNSSSCHSMTLSPDENVTYDTLSLDGDSFKYECWDNYYCSEGTLYDVYEKLNYLIIYSLHCHGNTDMLETVIAKHLGIDKSKVELSANMKKSGIDHDSVGNFNEIFEHESLLKNILFHPNSTILCEYDG